LREYLESDKTIADFAKVKQVGAGKMSRYLTEIADTLVDNGIVSAKEYVGRNISEGGWGIRAHNLRAERAGFLQLLDAYEKTTAAPVIEVPECFVKYRNELANEIAKIKEKCSTSDCWHYPYMYGLQFALDLLDGMNSPSPAGATLNGSAESL